MPTPDAPVHGRDCHNSASKRRNLVKITYLPVAQLGRGSAGEVMALLASFEEFKPCGGAPRERWGAVGAGWDAGWPRRPLCNHCTNFGGESVVLVAVTAGACPSPGRRAVYTTLVPRDVLGPVLGGTAEPCQALCARPWDYRWISRRRRAPFAATPPPVLKPQAARAGRRSSWRGLNKPSVK